MAQARTNLAFPDTLVGATQDSTVFVSLYWSRRRHRSGEPSKTSVCGVLTVIKSYINIKIIYARLWLRNDGLMQIFLVLFASIADTVGDLGELTTVMTVILYMQQKYQ